MTYRVSPVAEWTQIFNDAWRWYRDFFYDANMHGNDWKKIGDKFKAVIPELNNRGRPELAALADGRRAVRLAHLRVGRRLRARADAAEPGLHRAARRGPEGRRQRLPEAGAHPRADRLQQRPHRPARAAGHRREGGRLPHRRRRPRPEGRQPVPLPAGDPRPEGEGHRQRDAVGRRARRPTRSSRCAARTTCATTAGSPTTSRRCRRRRTANSATCTSRR